MNMSTLPLLWAASAVPVGGLMMVAFWVGLGNVRLLWRVLGFFACCAYLAGCSTAADTMFLADNAGGFTDFASRYLNDVISCVVVGLLVAAMFACMRRWFQLREVNSDYSPSESTRLRFSVFHLLALISFVAVVLSLARGARGEKATDAGIESWQWWAAGGLFVVTFFANTACAALAALGSARCGANAFSFWQSPRYWEPQ